MGVVQIAGVALIAAVLILCLRELRATAALPLRVGAGLLLVGTALALYAPVIGRIQGLFSMADAAEYATPILRATGIALIAELTASICRDLGENTLASGVLLFAKMEILVLCLPLVDRVLEIAKELLNF